MKNNANGIHVLTLFAGGIFAYVLSYGPVMGLWSNYLEHARPGRIEVKDDPILIFYSPLYWACHLLGIEDWAFEYTWCWFDYIGYFH